FLKGNPAPQSCRCPSGWTQNGKRCFIFVKISTDWASAELTCIRYGGNLASFHSRSEYIFLRTLVYRATGSHPRTWVGASDAAKVRAEPRFLLVKPRQKFEKLIFTIFILSRTVCGCGRMVPGFPTSAGVKENQTTPVDGRAAWRSTEPEEITSMMKNVPRGCISSVPEIFKSALLIAPNS
uniref:Galactose-specific lectin nattectin-like n=1 Tax=Kryptolebias marmoratus TaxID=37003 RepID=A0A3Q2ZRX6_KRYMA